MSPVRPIAFASTLDCGGRIATLGASENRWVLRVDGRDIPLQQAVSASGARWIGAQDPSVEVWNRGDRTRVTVDGREWPECRAAQPAAGSLRGPESFVARGNEPSWRLDVTAGRIRFVPGMDGPAVEAPIPPAQPAGAGRRWVADAGGGPLTVVALDRVCTDSMSGMPHPLTVTVEHGGRTWNGCGGEPASLLRGPEWIVEDLDGRGIVDRSRATLAFLPDGRIAGRASCNDYAGRWTLDGERLTIAGIGTTTKSCAPALANQERRFLDRLRAVAGFEIRPDGALRLRGPAPGDGDGTILARR
jgi:heat shock protein HslJ